MADRLRAIRGAEHRIRASAHAWPRARRGCGAAAQRAACIRPLPSAGRWMPLGAEILPACAVCAADGQRPASDAAADSLSPIRHCCWPARAAACRQPNSWAAVARQKPPTVHTASTVEKV
ncbi:hypothetical protein U9M48_000244 [Paspalum notatum var. saurae]|uniref:Uncharacterized protein n=1 Tax=Paspalum notatum var. saurae TaxID=547442 RepID=A0AAQ3SFU4_PASNO